MRKRSIFALALICVMMCLLTACGSARVQIDLTQNNSVTQAFNTFINNANSGGSGYSSDYRDKTFKVKGKIKSSGDDYHYIVTNDGCCNFTMEVRLADNSLSWPEKLNKTYTIVAKYTWYKSGGTSGFYFNIQEFC